MEWTLGALIIASIIVVGALFVNSIRLENEALKEMQKNKNNSWKWN